MRELAELTGHPNLSQMLKYPLSDEKRARAGVSSRLWAPHTGPFLGHPTRPGTFDAPRRDGGPDPRRMPWARRQAT